MEQKEMLALLKSQMHMTYAERREIAVHMNALSERLHQQEAEIEKLVQERGTMRLSSPAMEWISVKDRLPEEDVLVLGVNRINSAFGLWTFGNPDDAIIRITHWIPLPEPPQPKVPTFKDVFLKAFPKATISAPALTIDCCAVFPWLLDEEGCCQKMDMTCEECWNQPYFEQEEGVENGN